MAQRFRTDLKDEIVEGGFKLWRAVSTSGTKLLDNFKMERTNNNTQDGDSFGAKEANAIHRFLNGLLDGAETYLAHGIKNGDDTIEPRWVKNIGVCFDVNGEKNLQVADSVKVGGARVFAYTTTINPAGFDSVILPLPTNFGGSPIYLSVVNTNAYASRTTVTSVSMGRAGQVGIVVALSGLLTINTQLSVLVLTI